MIMSAFHTFQWQCLVQDYSIAHTVRRHPLTVEAQNSIPGQSSWDLWWTKCQWGRFLTSSRLVKRLRAMWKVLGLNHRLAQVSWLDFSLYSPVPPDKYQDSISIRLLSHPPKFFPIHRSITIMLPFGATEFRYWHVFMGVTNKRGLDWMIWLIEHSFITTHNHNKSQ
jgi:hypothetical protein